LPILVSSRCWASIKPKLRDRRTIGDLLVLERLIAASQGDHIFRVCAEDV
jgi:hypothetical protein